MAGILNGWDLKWLEPKWLGSQMAGILNGWDPKWLGS